LDTDEIIIVEGFRREDQRVKVCEIAEVTVITKKALHEIISDLNSISCLTASMV
jgi:hypothetical protein